jgi:hypothetical protein
MFIYLFIYHQHLYEHAIFNYRGRLHPGLTIKAEVRREEVSVTVQFEVRDKGIIGNDQE